jgi:hypothetical protein
MSTQTLLGAALLLAASATAAYAQSAEPNKPAAVAAVDKKEGAAAKDRDGAAKKPQVRTYSSVTVVDDPRKVPPLPTLKREGDAARPSELKRELAAPERAGASGAASGERPGQAEVRGSDRARELRSEIKAARRELRDEGSEREAPAGSDAAKSPSEGKAAGAARPDKGPGADGAADDATKRERPGRSEREDRLQRLRERALERTRSLRE